MSKVLYDDIGVTYDNTRCTDPFITETIINLLDCSIHSKILDIACGTGNYTTALYTKGFDITGVDISDVMIKKAKEKCPNISWICNNADHIELESGLFDGAVCTLACHHFPDLHAVFSEVYRLLNKGKFVILSCTHLQIRNYWLYHYFPEVLEYMITYMPDIDVMIKALVDSGFRLRSLVPYYITPETKDNFFGSRIEQPELYLNEGFRSGMSIFAEKANPLDIELGCLRLESELKSGAFDNHIRTHKNHFGDYIFITVEKL